MILEAGKELGDPSNGNPSKDTETEKMAVAADDHLGVSGNRTLKNAVVRRIGFDRLDDLRRVDESDDDTQLPVGLGQPFGSALELVPEDAKGLCADGFGDGKIDLTFNGEVEKLLRLASELQCADEDVGVSDDALQTACSTTASTSASLMSPRRWSPSRPMRSSHRRARSRSIALVASSSTVVPSASAICCTRS